MKNKKAILVMWLLALLPFVLVALAWPHLPERVPTHWGLDGEINGWSSPAALWGLCAIGPALALLLQFLPKVDPKKRNYEKFQGWYDWFAALMPLILAVVMAMTLSESLWPGRVNVSRAVCVLLGVLFLVIGNMMGKVKSNWFMGVRTPWALSDGDVWNKTQRLGGWVLFLSGLLLLVLTFLVPPKVVFFLFFAVLLGGLALTYFMSWKWFRDKERE